MIDGDDGGMLRNHMECIVQITDKKYGIEGFYIADPTIDSFDAPVEEGSAVAHALMNIDEYENLYAGESEIVHDDEPSRASYYFLRDNKLIPDEKLIEESKAPLRMVQEIIKTPKFVSEFNSFTNKLFVTSVTDNDLSCVEIKRGDKSKKFETIVIGNDSYTIDEIAKDEKLMSALAMRLYAISDYTPDIEMEVMEKFLQKSYFRRRINDLKQGKKTNLDLSKNIASNELIMFDPILLSEIGRFEDYKTLLNANSNNMMRAIGKVKFQTPKMTDYVYALRNVYMANGYSPEEARLYTNILISNSVEAAYSQGWDMITTKNPFAAAAKIEYADEINEMEGLLTPKEQENQRGL